MHSCTLHISSKHYMGPTPVYGARAEKSPQNADFAMKQTNICRLSGDLNERACNGRDDEADADTDTQSTQPAC